MRIRHLYALYVEELIGLGQLRGAPLPDATVVSLRRDSQQLAALPKTLGLSELFGEATPGWSAVAAIPLMTVVICRLWIEVDFARQATRNGERVSEWVGRLKRRRRAGSAGRVASGPAGSLGLSEAGVRVDESRPTTVTSSE